VTQSVTFIPEHRRKRNIEMKLLKCGLLVFAFCVRAYASPCEHGSIKDLEITWKAFRRASLDGNPSETSKFYRFPLIIASPADEALTFKISKNKFLNKYKELFKEIVPGEEIELFSELKNSRDDDYKDTLQQFMEDGCSRTGHASIYSYEFAWSKKRGWHISAISPPGYSIMQQEAK
jgi:hypothetical protein